MKKINVEICLGTTCFVMGASKLQDLEKFIPKKYKEYVDISAKTCLDLCKNNEFSKSPYVKLNDEIISEANVEKVVSAIARSIDE